jgi:hypothetical protein
MTKELVEKVIEHLEEMKKVVVDDIEDLSELQNELEKRGYFTHFFVSDHDYLRLDERVIK